MTQHASLAPNSKLREFVQCLQAISGEHQEALSLIAFLIATAQTVDRSIAQPLETGLAFWPMSQAEMEIPEFTEKFGPVYYTIHNHCINVLFDEKCKCHPMFLGLLGLIALHQASKGKMTESEDLSGECAARESSSTQFIAGFLETIFNLKLKELDSDAFTVAVVERLNQIASVQSDYEQRARDAFFENLTLDLYIVASNLA